MSEPAIATLLIGIVIGYVGQRSRMCFVGGLRDFLLVRDTELLRGLLAFAVTAWVGFSAAGSLGLIGTPAANLGVGATAPADSSLVGRLEGWFASIGSLDSYLLVTVAAAFALGLLSVLANGCPFRQHVLAAQGGSRAMLYLVGFYGGALLYAFFVQDWIFQIL